MRAGMLVLALGLASLRFITELPPTWLIGLGLSAGCGLLLSRFSAVGLYILGLSWACLAAHWAMEARLPAALDGRTLWLEGRVVGLPEQSEGVVRFELAEAQSRRAQLPNLLRLSWRDGPQLQSGERWRLAVKLRRPRGLINPHAFDYDAWLLAKGVGATGSVKHGERLQPAAVLSSWRDELRQQLLSQASWAQGGALAALVLGDGSGLTTEQWRVLQHTGTVHLMVISGQHITLMAGLLYGLVAGLARLGWWPRNLPWLPWACALAFAGAVGYGVLAGFEVPVRRACVMVALVLLWRLRFRHLGLWWPLLMAWNLVLISAPLAVLQAGFWLSFTAVAVLIVVLGGRLGVSRWWRSLIGVQVAMAIGLLPGMLALGLPVSLSGPLANLLAVPWVGLIVVPLALLGTLFLPVPIVSQALLWLAGAALTGLFTGLQALAALMPAWIPSAVQLWQWLLLALGAIVFLLPAGVPGRAFGPLLCLPALVPNLQVPAPGLAQVWMFDVGQGLSVLVRTRGHALLFDTGARFGDFDVGERVILPSLRALGLQELDAIIISHADNDHAGGAPALLNSMRPARVLSGEVARLPADWLAQPCLRQRWEWDGVEFQLWRWTDAPDGNAASCVLKVTANGQSLLLTADIDAAAERVWLNNVRSGVLQWLQVPHHGSRSSSSQAFIEALQPQAALVSRGWQNSFGHPHSQVKARYQARAIQWYDTAESGALSFTLGRDLSASGLRAEPRFWREK